MIVSACLGRTEVYHRNLQLHREPLFHHFASKANPQRPLQEWGWWYTSRIIQFPVRKPIVPYMEKVLELYALYGRNGTEVIHQEVASNQFWQILIFV